jgi:hypothetical protein
MKTGGHPTLLARPGLSLVRRRWLAAPGEVLVAPGDRVTAQTVVARSRPTGALVPVNVAHQLDMAPEEVPAALTVAPGAAVTRGSVIARWRSLWGLLSSSCRSPVTGIVQEVSPRTGQVLIASHAHAVEVPALLDGEVVAVTPERGADIAGRATVVQGIIGLGGEVYGPLVAAVKHSEGVVTAEMIGPELAGHIVLGGAIVTGSALRRAAEVGVAALVTGGVEDSDLTELLGGELSVAVTGRESVRPVVIVTGGFGRVPPDPVAFDLLRDREGEGAWACGATRVRAGAVRPEIVVPELAGRDNASSVARRAGVGDVRSDADGRLAVGRRVRLVGIPHLGTIGTVASLPLGRRTFSSEGRLPAVEVLLAGKRKILVPRANVELLDTPDPPAPTNAASWPTPAPEEET